MYPPPKKFSPDSETGGIFDPQSTFESFVVGHNNASACAAAKAVADPPDTAHNQLVLYGGVGGGKTHLLHAIGQSVAANRPDARISYLTAAAFTHEFMVGDQTTRFEKFLQKCRQTDLLLIDDNQFRADQERIQFAFYLLLSLPMVIETPIHIVLTCGCPANEIQTFGQRLALIFDLGLVVPLPPPDLKTRLTVLRRQAHALGVTLPEDIINLLARRIRSSIRQLKGALVRVAAYASLSGRELTVPVVKGLPRELLHEEDRCSNLDAAQSDMGGVQIVTLSGGSFPCPTTAAPQPSLSSARWSF